MPKTKISEWSSTPANNTDIDSINIAEGCAPSGINDAIRELMSQVKDLYAGTSGDIIAVAAGGTGVGTSTGSGNNVLSTSPTLVTPALGTPSALVGTNITGTAANFNINGTVGATTANTGAFTTLAASSTVTLSGGTANGVTYLNGSKVLTSGSGLVFDGTNSRLSINQSSSIFGAQLEVTASTSGQTVGIHGRSADGLANIVFGSNGGATEYARIQSDNTSSLQFGTGSSGTEQMRLTTTGLGIGTSSPADKLEVYSTITARASSGTSAFRLRNTTTDMQWQSVAGTNAVSLFDSGAGLTRLTVDSAGNVTLQKNISVGGATVTTSGTGITFPATQSASTDANTLDDYEEGTWTPTDGSGASLSFTGVQGTYTKVGRLVTALAELTYPTTASTANAIIGGLPFTASGAGINGYIRYTSVATSLVNYVSGGASGTSVSLFRPGTNTTNVSMSAGTLLFAVIYYV